MLAHTTPPTPSKPKNPFTQTLLTRAHRAPVATQIHADRILHKPLQLTSNTVRPTSQPPSTDARDARRARRESQKPRRRKPKPLSAKEKRAKCVYEIPKHERRWDIYVGLRGMWWGYIREILGITSEEYTQGLDKMDVDGGTATYPNGIDVTAEKKDKRPVWITPQFGGGRLASADFHGAEVRVVRSRCVSRVGVRGIVVRDTKFTFEVVTRENRVVTLPKEHSVFRVEVPFTKWDEKDVDIDRDGNEKEGRRLVFEIHGEQIKNRAPERANKKFRMHISPDL